MVVVVVVIGYTLALTTTNGAVLAVSSPAENASIPKATNEISADFNETGTLVFYPNNVGPVPYLFYQDRIGHTVAKALIFPDSSPANFSSWSGAHISVAGMLNQEHVVVSRIDYLSGP